LNANDETNAPAESQNNSNGGISRRGFFGSMAAAALLTSCTACCHEQHDGYGVPNKAKDYPGDNALAIRANFALWLLFSTSELFYPINRDNPDKPVITIAGGLDLSKLVSDMQYLPGDTASQKEAYIKGLTDYLMAYDTFDANVEVNGQMVSAQVSLITALRGVRVLFQNFSSGLSLSEKLSKVRALDQAPLPPYTPGGNCPRGSREILTLVKDTPTALYPPGD
jgi:hypothetical protein